MDKEQFLNRIARQLGRGRLQGMPEWTALSPEDFLDRKAASPSPEELADQFIAGWRGLGGVAERVRTALEAREKLSEVISRHEVHSVAMWEHPALGALGLAETIQAAGKRLFLTQADISEAERKSEPSPPCPKDQGLSACQLGITWADFAIASTATVVLASSPGQARAVSLLPPVHLIFMTERQLVRSMGEIWAPLFRREGAPSSVNFVSGPSRSSDIENDLSIGVHGPGVTYAFILPAQTSAWK